MIVVLLIMLFDHSIILLITLCYLIILKSLFSLLLLS